MLPIVVQLFEAVARLHQLDIAHQDLSLENILLTDDVSGGLQVKLVDFGHAAISRRSKPGQRLPGKAGYRAPEMYTHAEYDRFSADVFSLGVVIYTMAVKDYPWSSTQAGHCKRFDYACKHGVSRLFSDLKLPVQKPACELVSAELLDLLRGCLRLEPTVRATLEEGNGIFLGPIWSFTWLEDALQIHCDKRVSSVSSLSTIAPDSLTCDAESMGFAESVNSDAHL